MQTLPQTPLSPGGQHGRVAGRPRQDTMRSTHAVTLKSVSRQTVSLSSVSDCVRGPELRLRRVQLLAAAAVAAVTDDVSGGRDEQHEHSDVCCAGGGVTL